MLHGTADMGVPYVNGKAVYDKAQSVGLPSKFITMDGQGHADSIKNYLTDLEKSLYLLVTKDAEAPDACKPLNNLFMQ